MAQSNKNIYIAIIITTIFGLVLFSSVLFKLSTPQKSALAQPETIDSTKVVEPVAQPETKGWEYATTTDEMYGTENRFANLESDNTIKLDAPYYSARLAIVCRYMKKYGYDVIIRASSGQLLCSEYSNTNYVMVKFDDKAPKKYYTNEPSDHSSDHVFLAKPRDFIKEAKSAKKIMVEVYFYQGGCPRFTFTTDKELVFE